MDSIFFLIYLWMLFMWFLCFKLPQIQSRNYCKKHEIDHRKVNLDRTLNDLPEWMINKNILDGKYTKGPIKTQEQIKKERDATWEEFKKKHPWGSWN